MATLNFKPGPEALIEGSLEQHIKPGPGGKNCECISTSNARTAGASAHQARAMWVLCHSMLLAQLHWTSSWTHIVHCIGLTHHELAGLGMWHTLCAWRLQLHCAVSQAIWTSD